jgi:protein O-mannosyl-transferase
MAKRRRQRAAPAAAAPRARASSIGWLALLPAALVVLAYLNALGNPFVYDDRPTVVDNPSLRDLSNWRYILAYTPFRPLVNISYALDRLVWGVRPLGYHLTSLLLHALNATLLLRLGARAAEDSNRRGAMNLDPSAVGFAAAALFAVHPLLSEAVAYASGRSELVAGTFFLCGLLSARRWFRGDGAGWAAGYLGCLALALGSKESGAALVVVAWLYDALLGGQEGGGGRGRRAWLHGALVVLGLAAAAYRLHAYLGTEMVHLDRGFGVQLRTEAVVLWRYLRLLALPYGQSLIHPAQSIPSPLDPRALAAIAGLAAVAYLLWRSRRRAPVVTLGCVWFVAALAPSSVVPLFELMSEHRLYVATAGLALAAGAGWSLWQGRPAARGWARAVLAAAIAILLALTVARNRVWADTVTLWRDAAAKAPLTWAPRYALADALRARDGCAAAVPVYREALELKPGDGATLTNLGTCLAVMRNYAEAEAVLEQALTAQPNSANLLNNLGQLARMTGRPALARERFAAAIAIDPRHAPTRISLAALEEAEGNVAEALRLCSEAMLLAPQLPEARACVERLSRR